MESIEECFILKEDDLITIISKLEIAFNTGLLRNHDMFYYRPLKMVPTYLSNIIEGDEIGRFIAIDLGGTNLRFIEIYVENGKLIPTSLAKKVPEKCMTGTGEELFDFVAQYIEECLNILKLADKDIRCLGFTFSFPCNQMKLNSAILIRWTKGYCSSDVEGKDVVFLLKEAVRRRNLKIKDIVLINDTTGTLLCGAFEQKNTRIGVINGTGTNACYIESTSKISKWKSPIEDDSVIINTEWGSFGENGELSNILSFADIELDRDSINPGSQIFEKMISGMYLGEIVRLILKKAHKLNLIFKNGFPDLLNESYSLQSAMISLSYLEDIFVSKFNKKFKTCLENSDYAVISRICDMVSKRSACLCAAGLQALLQRLNKPKTVIAVDGSMFTKHPFYKNYVENAINSLKNKNNFKIIKVDDGSGKGAALAACVASIHYYPRTDMSYNN